MPTSSTPRLLLAGVVLELTLATALIHLSLGGTLFLLNALGYLALGAAYLAVVALPIPAVRRVAWLPRIGLVAYASITILAYVLTGPYFTLGWVTKGVELAIVMLVVADILIDADAGGAPGRPPRSARP